MDDLSFGASDRVVVRVEDEEGNEKDSFLAPKGGHLWTLLRKRGHFPDVGCSGVGGCGRCAVRLHPPEVCPVGSAEEQARHRLGMTGENRLSCHVFLSCDCSVRLGRR